MSTPNVTQIQQVNSTSYADEVGILIGLDRLPGETTTAYVQRLEAATQLRRDQPYEGALNGINLALGFLPSPYIHLAIPANTVVSVSIAGIVVGSHPRIPLLTFDVDAYWNFRKLSEIVTDLNALTSATLLVDDGPAFQLARQSNSLFAFSEPVGGQTYQLKATSGVQVGSELFNQTVPAYTLTAAGQLVFEAEPNAGTTITYNYIVTPYDLVGAPVSLIGLTDREFPAVAETSSSQLAFQVSEFVQAAMLQDRSYWAE